MDEREKQRVIHITILSFITICLIGLTVESVLMGWEMGAVVLLLLGLCVSWGIYVRERIPESIRLWLYFILTMLALFFYGIHETSIYDLAPMMIFVIFVHSVAEQKMMINLCVVTYYLTMCYDFLFVLKGSVELSPLLVSRILLHLVLVYMAGYLAKVMMKMRKKERKITDGRIQELEEINSRTEDFMTNVSHELRTPINAVTGISAVMLKNEEDADKKKDILSIQKAGNRLFGQIEDILDYTEIDTGRIQVSEDNYMVSSIINDIVIGDQLMEKVKGLELILDIDAGIPSVLLGDGRKIKKILRHLIDNAIKFTKKGAVYVRVYALRKTYGINLCIEVSDTGIGIDEESFEKITERFFQSDGGRSRRNGGLGLGLPIVYGMVAAMEGFIQIESTVGSKTTVSVSIPQKIVEDSSCMSVANRADLCLACYLRPEKYEVPEVRDYYNEMIAHMICGLDLSLHRVFHLEEMKELTARYQLTHLFIGREEYEESKSYFESLAEGMEVVVAADDSFLPPQGSRIHILRKPLYALSVINLLNSEKTANADTFSKERMICPKIRVLVVDDEPMNLMVAEGIFKDYQMKVSTAGSGIEAIELCKKEDFDLIFLDHMMPEIDGVETLKQLHKIYADSGRVPTIIAFTANAVSGAREMFLREGFDEFVSKPIEYLEMERVLRKVLPKSSIAFVDENYVKKNKLQKTERHKVGEDPFGEKPVQKEDSRESDGLNRLKNVGININAGIQYCKDDMEFYEDVLIKFAQSAAGKAEEINDFYLKKDFSNYQIRVHALKSSAKMIGADSLSEMARKAEEAAKNQNEGYIQEHHEEILTGYSEIAQHILDALDTGENGSEQEEPQSRTEIVTEELVRRLEELKEKLDTFEADQAENMISGLSGFVHQGTTVEDLLHEIRQDVEDFELGAASEKVEALIRSMKGGEA